jgi:hypothetical protein
MAVQLWKIWRRVAEQRATGRWITGYATSGLIPFREFMAFMMFFAFFTSGLTRNQIDLMLVSTRFPAVFISVAIVTAIFLDQRTAVSKIMLSVAALLTIFGGFLFYSRLTGSITAVEFIAKWIDGSMLFLLIPFLIGRVRNAYVIWNLPERSVASAVREIGNGLKDLTGMYYAFGRFEDLFFVFVTHTVSVLTSVSLLAAIMRNKRRTTEALEHREARSSGRG